MGLAAAIDPVSSTEYPTRAHRPKNSALLSERSLVKPRSWQDALKAYLVEEGHISASFAVRAGE